MTTKIRNSKNVNITINSKRVLRKVLENMEVAYNMTKDEKKLVANAVETTLWELFERKEEAFKDYLKSYDDSSYAGEFK